MEERSRCRINNVCKPNNYVLGNCDCTRYLLVVTLSSNRQEVEEIDGWQQTIRPLLLMMIVGNEADVKWAKSLSKGRYLGALQKRPLITGLRINHKEMPTKTLLLITSP